MKVNSLGKKGSGKKYNPVTSETQKLLNGKTLAEAINEGIILNDESLEFATIKGDGRNGPYEMVVLGTNLGDVRIADSLAENLIDHVDAIGDLEFAIGISDKSKGYSGNEYFRLKAQGNYNQTREAFMAKEFAEA